MATTFLPRYILRPKSPYHVFHQKRLASTPSSKPAPASRLRRSLLVTTGITGAAFSAYNWIYTDPESTYDRRYSFIPHSLSSVQHLTPPTSPTQIAIFTLTLPESLSPTSSDPSRTEHFDIANPLIQIYRNYTPLPSTSPNEYRFLIKLIPQGEMSRYLFSLKPGSKIGLRGPHSTLGFEIPKEPSHIIFIAAGTGIAPALQLSQKLPKESKMTVLWAVRHRDEIEGLREELRRCGVEAREFVDAERIFINAHALKDVLKEDGGPTKTVVVSGPEGFNKYLAGETPGDDESDRSSPGLVQNILKEMKGDANSVSVHKLRSRQVPLSVPSA